MLDEEDSSEDSGIPSIVAWMMFLKFKNCKSDADLARAKDIDVYKDWNIFLYMLARGLLSDYKL